MSDSHDDTCGTLHNNVEYTERGLRGEEACAGVYISRGGDLIGVGQMIL